jgi:hypothetical protein
VVWEFFYLYCFGGQDNKWTLEDYSGVVIRAAELEGLFALGRLTEHGGGRLPLSAVVAMAANAHKIRASIGSAIVVLRQAKPPPKRPSVPFPCFTGASLSASQVSSPSRPRNSDLGCIGFFYIGQSFSSDCFA